MLASDSKRNDKRVFKLFRGLLAPSWKDVCGSLQRSFNALALAPIGSLCIHVLFRQA